MKKIKSALDRKVGESGVFNGQKVYFTNDTIAEILKENGCNAIETLPGEYNLPPEKFMTAILLKYCEYYGVSYLDTTKINHFRPVWYAVANSEYAGIDVIFNNIYERYDNKELSKVISLLGTDNNRKVFAKALAKTEKILTELDKQNEIKVIKKIKAATDLYVIAAKEFEEREKEFYMDFYKKLFKNEEPFKTR